MTATSDEEDPELSAPAYLRDLAGRIRHIAALHGVNGYDVDRLHRIAGRLDRVDVALAAVKAIDDRMNDEDRDGGPYAPTGDDYNTVWGLLMPLGVDL